MEWAREYVSNVAAREWGDGTGELFQDIISDSWNRISDNFYRIWDEQIFSE